MRPWVWKWVGLLVKGLRKERKGKKWCRYISIKNKNNSFIQEYTESVSLFLLQLQPTWSYQLPLISVNSFLTWSVSSQATIVFLILRHRQIRLFVACATPLHCFLKMSGHDHSLRSSEIITLFLHSNYWDTLLASCWPSGT